MRMHRPAAATGAVAAATCLLLAGGGCRGRRSVEPPDPPALPNIGSGVLVSEEGHFLTTARVVESARRLQVVICEQDRRHRFAARVVASDPRTGLVLCRADARKGWALAWVNSLEETPDDRVACGWPFLALAPAGRHEREVSLRSGAGDATSLHFPLARGFEGGPVTTHDGVGLGVISTLAEGGVLLARPRVVPAAELLQFLRASGISPVMARHRRSMTPSALAARMVWSVVRVEGEPAPGHIAAAPRLLWKARLSGDDVTQLRFTDGGPIVALTWAAAGTERVVALRRSDGTVVGHAPAQKTTLSPPSREIHDRVVEFRLDRRGRMTATERSTGRVLYEVAERNGGLGVGSRGAPSLSQDGRLLLVGDALLWAPSGAVLWRLLRRLDRPADLAPDGTALALARDSTLVELWGLPRVGAPERATPSGTTSPAGGPAVRPDRRP